MEFKSIIFMFVFWLSFTAFMLWVGVENRKEAKANEEKEKLATFEKGYVQACKHHAEAESVLKVTHLRAV